MPRALIVTLQGHTDNRRHSPGITALMSAYDYVDIVSSKNGV